MAESIEYKYLKPKPGSNYRQLFISGRIRAEILYRKTVGREPLTPAEVAQEYGLPIDAVEEAIDYRRRNPELLDAERAREVERIKAAGRDQWPYAPRDSRGMSRGRSDFSTTNGPQSCSLRTVAGNDPP